MRRIASKLFLLVSILCYVIAIYSIYERTNPRRVSFAEVKVVQSQLPKKTQKNLQNPVYISIPSINLNLPIKPANIYNGTWEVTTEGVSYLVASPIPGETGNSILYGHNWASLLGRLPNLQTGEAIEITYTDGSKKVFDVEYTVEVTPEQVDILAQSKDKRITLYTCTGFLDARRFVAVAMLRTN